MLKVLKVLKVAKVLKSNQSAQKCPLIQSALCSKVPSAQHIQKSVIKVLSTFLKRAQHLKQISVLFSKHFYTQMLTHFDLMFLKKRKNMIKCSNMQSVCSHNLIQQWPATDWTELIPYKSQMSRMKVKVKSCKFSLFREEKNVIINMISPSSPTPPLSPLPPPIPSSPPVRHGICHGCLEIVLVKYYFTGGK